MKRTKLHKLSWVSSAAIGGSICMLLSVLTALVGTILIENSYIELQSAKYVITVGQALSVFTGCFIAGKIAEQKNMLACAIAAGVYYLVLAAIAILFFDGITGQFLRGLIAVAVGAGGSVFALNRRKTTRKRKKAVLRFR